MTVPRMASNKLNRENSFHVQATPSKDTKPQQFSWAKIARHESSEDRLSTISSRDDLDDMKSTQLSTEKQDCATQTDAEMLRSILRMPYLRRRNGKKIERTSAIDDEFMSVKVNPTERFGCPKKLSSPISFTRNGSKKKDTYGGSNNSKSAQERTKLLYPGYSDDPVSVSDDFENEDFEYYDSISHLMQVHNPASMNNVNMVPHVAPVCAHDEGMTNYLNPLGTNGISPDSEIDVTIESLDKEGDRTNRRPPCHLIVENKPNGTTTSVIKDPLLHRHNASSASLKDSHYSNNTHSNYHKSLSNKSLSLERGADSSIHPSHNSTGYRRRASSPANPFASCNSLPNNETDLQRLSAFTRGSYSSKVDTSPTTFPCFKSTDDITQRYIQTLDKEETSMLQFQNFMKERGVNLDMACIESSDV